MPIELPSFIGIDYSRAKEQQLPRVEIGNGLYTGRIESGEIARAIVALPFKYQKAKEQKMSKVLSSEVSELKQGVLATQKTQRLAIEVDAALLNVAAALDNIAGSGAKMPDQNPISKAAERAARLAFIAQLREIGMANPKLKARVILTLQYNEPIDAESAVTVVGSEPQTPPTPRKNRAPKKSSRAKRK